MWDGKLGPIDGDNDRYALGVAERVSNVLATRPTDSFRIACAIKGEASTEFPNLSDSKQGGPDSSFDFTMFNFLSSGHDQNGAELISEFELYTPSIARLAFAHTLLNIASSSRTIRVSTETGPPQIIISPEM